MARTDAHRPGAMSSKDYEVLALINVFPDEDNEGNPFMNAEMEPLSDRWEEIGSPYESTVPGHKAYSCDHCGHYLKWECIVEHKASGEILVIGRSCVARFMHVDWTLAEQIIRARVEGKNNVTRWTKRHPEYTDLMLWAAEDKGIAGDMYRKLYRYGSLSPKQVEFMDKLKAEAEQRAAELAARIVCDCPVGRIEITGTVLGLKWVESGYGWQTRSTLKMIVSVPAGYRVFGTVPSSLLVVKGDEVRFTATVERSEKDAAFGFFSRPTKAICLTVHAEDKTDEDIDETPCVPGGSL